MKDALTELLQTNLKIIMLLADEPLLAKGFTDSDFETLSVYMGQTAEVIEKLGGKLND